jgi:hypothetical protein
MKHPETPFPLSGPSPEPFYVGDRLVEPALNRISGGDGPVSIEPRVMHVLVCPAG